MLDWIINFFSSIGDTINSLINLLVSLIKGTFDLFAMLPTIITLLVDSIGFLPSVVSLFAFLSVTVSVVYLVAGRNTN